MYEPLNFLTSPWGWLPPQDIQPAILLRPVVAPGRKARQRWVRGEPQIGWNQPTILEVSEGWENGLLRIISGNVWAKIPNILALTLIPKIFPIHRGSSHWLVWDCYVFVFKTGWTVQSIEIPRYMNIYMCLHIPYDHYFPIYIRSFSSCKYAERFEVIVIWTNASPKFMYIYICTSFTSVYTCKQYTTILQWVLDNKPGWIHISLFVQFGRSHFSHQFLILLRVQAN